MSQSVRLHPAEANADAFAFFTCRPTSPVSRERPLTGPAHCLPRLETWPRRASTISHSRSYPRRLANQSSSRDADFTGTQKPASSALSPCADSPTSSRWTSSSSIRACCARTYTVCSIARCRLRLPCWPSRRNSRRSGRAKQRRPMPSAHCPAPRSDACASDTASLYRLPCHASPGSSNLVCSLVSSHRSLVSSHRNERYFLHLVSPAARGAQDLIPARAQLYTSSCLCAGVGAGGFREHAFLCLA